MCILDHISTGFHVAQQFASCPGSHEKVGLYMYDKVHHGSEPGLWEKDPGLDGIETCSYKFSLLDRGLS